LFSQDYAIYHNFTGKKALQVAQMDTEPENNPFDLEPDLPQTETGNKRKRWFVLASITVLIVLIPVWFWLSLPDVSLYKTKNPAQTALMELRQAANPDLKIKQRWISLKSIPKLLQRSVIISEDAAFWSHEGVDFDELKESIKKNWEEGRMARGGSTITQQLAKNLYLSTNKSLFRKFREYFIAKDLEKEMSKSRILELYFNVIEFGDGIFGIEAAARHHFGKTTAMLSTEEIVRLTAIIPRPLIENPNKMSRWLRWRCRWITGKLKRYGEISPEEHDQLLTVFQ
jgi:monofunctional biosynthetic peptidoglycan transglycosylase